MTCWRSTCCAKATHLCQFWVEGVPMRVHLCGGCFHHFRGSSMSMAAYDAAFHDDQPPSVQ